MAESYDLRIILANARDTLRRAQDYEAAQRLIVYEQAITEAGGAKALGANEAERERALGLALLRDVTYTSAMAALRAAELARDLAAAAVESADILSREREIAANERLAAALESRVASIFSTAING